jgi:hypothetical protein
MPAVGKRPKFGHKLLPVSHPGGGVPRWTRTLARKNLHEFDRCDELGLLMTESLLVVDFDTEAVYAEWHEQFKELFDSTALVRTKKGYHVYLKRSTYADAKQVYDGPMGFLWSAEQGKVVKRDIDLKTLTASTSTVLDDDGAAAVYHTPGFLSTPPSTGKLWVRSIFEWPPVEISDALVDRIVEERAKPPGSLAPRHT